jgi:hypothetical protein
MRFEVRGSGFEVVALSNITLSLSKGCRNTTKKRNTFFQRCVNHKDDF